MNDFIIFYFTGFLASFFYYNVVKPDIMNDQHIDIFLFFYIFSIYFTLRFFLFLIHSFHFTK